ncbi:MAG: hypothetical protein ABW198_01580 [Pseudorhodoplanes sp.]
MTRCRFIAIALATLLGSSAFAEDDKVETGNAVYEIRPDPKNEQKKCVFKHGKRLLCIERDLVSFGPVIRTKDFAIVPIYDDCGGSNCGRSETTLLIERGKDTKIDRTLKRFCAECQNKYDAKSELNEVSIALDRKDGHAFSAMFRNGVITVAKKPLDPKEPLADDDCTYLYEDLLDTCIGTAKCRNVVADLPGANSRSLRFMSVTYAAFPQGKMAAMCEAACAAKKKPARADFDRDICRR